MEDPSIEGEWGAEEEWGADEGQDVRQEVHEDIISGCSGPPLARYAGRSESFVDGFGLCSPGRWHPSFRSQAMNLEPSDFAALLRAMVDDFCRSKIKDLARQTFELALGRFKESPFSSTDLEELRAKWFKSLPDLRGAAVLCPGQPFCSVPQEAWCGGGAPGTHHPPRTHAASPQAQSEAIQVR